MQWKSYGDQKRNTTAVHDTVMQWYGESDRKSGSVWISVEEEGGSGWTWRSLVVCAVNTEAFTCVPCGGVLFAYREFICREVATR